MDGKKPRVGSLKAPTYLSFFGLALTIPLLLLFGALLYQSASAQRAQLEVRLSHALEALISNIDRDLDRDLTILRTLATSEALAKEDWRTFYSQAKASLQGRAYLVVTDAQGRQLVNTYVPYGQQPAMTGDPETIRRIGETKAPVISNLFMSQVVKKPVFNVSIPVLQNGQVRNVMSLGLLPDDLLALLNAQHLEPDWVMTVWDANNIILARSPGNARFVGMPLPQNLRGQAQPGVFRTTNLDGVEVLRATAHSPLSGWGVGVNIPYALVAQQARNSLLEWVAASVIAILIALFAGGFFARQITMPLSVAGKAAAAFGHGESFPIAGSRLKEANEFLVTLQNAQQAREKLTTEIRQSEERFRKISAELTTMLQTAAVGLARFNRDLRFLSANPAYEKLVGVPLDRIIGRTIVEVIGENAFQVIRPNIERVLSGEQVEYEAEVPLAGGAKWTHIMYSPERDEHGNVVGWVASINDITQRKLAEKETARTKSLLETLLVTAPVGICYLDRHLRFLMINNRLAEMNGLPVAAHIGNAVGDIVPALLATVQDVTGRILATGDAVMNQEFSGETPSAPGVRRYWNESWFPVRDDRGEIVGFGAVVEEVTERKQAEAAFRGSLARAQKGESLLNAIMDYVPEGITYAEAPDVTIRMVSRYGREMLGQRREMLEGIPVEEHARRWNIYRLDGTLARGEELPLTRAVTKGEVVLDEEWMVRDSSGRMLFILCNAAPVRDGDGNIFGGVIAWHDITQRKENELALARANEDLNQFAFAASHDLQEPLRMITSYSQLLLKGFRGQLDEDAGLCVKFITEGTTRMRELLADLLAYAQVANKTNEAVAPVDLNLVFQLVLENYKMAIRETKATVTSDPLPAIGGRESHFVQLLQNLISNGLKYRAAGRPPRIHVSAEKQDGLWRFGVKDNGMGIAPEYHEQIFAVFKRLHRKEIPGTGIGLAICQRVIQRYGGKIWVESRENEGSTFYFTLPASAEQGAVANG